MSDQPQANTDRELWREVPGDYYSPSIHVTEGRGIGINVGGSVFVKPVREWHKLAAALPPNAPTAAEVGDEFTITTPQGEVITYHPGKEGYWNATQDGMPDVWGLSRVASRAVSALLAARRENETLAVAAKNCADDLEAEVRARYGHPDIHPSQRRKYEMDMEPVSVVRAALAAAHGEDK